MGRKIGVVGTVIRDTIHHRTGGTTNALGGVLYTILPMRAFLPENWEIVPILRIGSDLYDEVSRLFSGLPNVSTVNVIRDRRENNRVDLCYNNAEDRTEVATRGVSPILPREVKGLETIDCLVLNFISGWEISLVTMRGFSGRFGGRVFADMHSLMLGRSPDGTRYPRKPYGWKRWLGHFYYVQMNLAEARTLTGLDLNGSAGDREANLSQASAAIHGLGPSVVAITLGEEGAFLTRVTRGGSFVCEQRDGHRIQGAADPTGSGDVFLAAYTSATLLGRSSGEALSFAVRSSALSTTVKGAGGLHAYFREQQPS